MSLSCGLGRQDASPSGTADRRSERSVARRAAAAVRYMVMVGVLVGAAGVAGTFLDWPLLTSTLGPTAYVFAAHPHSESARFSHAALGHAVAIGCGVGSLLVLGLLHHPSVSAAGRPDLTQVWAAIVAAGVTMLLLELANSHHAPAAATALLVATGLAKPGAPLIGLVIGLAIVIALGPLIGMVAFGEPPTASEEKL